MKNVLKALLLVVFGCSSKLDGTVIEDKIIINTGQDTVMLRREIYGLTGGNDKIYVGKGKLDSANYYVYYGSAGFYYQYSKDTIFIYTTKKSHIPKTKLKAVQIEQVVLNNAEMMEMHKNYKNKGLKTLEVPLAQN